jgi:phosphotransferase system HPr (HPr) family protein
MLEAKVTLTNKVGLHARPAAVFVQTANKCVCNIMVRNLTTARDPVNAKSIISILSLGALQDHEIIIMADGSDEERAIDLLKALIINNFGES